MEPGLTVNRNPQQHSRNSDDELPYTGAGLDLQGLTRRGLEIRPIPLSAGLNPDGGSWAYEHVFSPFSRVYFARHDNLFVESEGEQYQIPENGFLLIPAQLHFNCHAGQRQEHMWIHFDLDPPYLHEFSRPVRIEGNATTHANARLVWDTVENSSSLHVCVHRIKALLHLLLGEMDLGRESTLPVQLHRALRLMNHSVAEIRTVSDLARLAGYSPEHLAYLFRRHTQSSPSDFLRQCRTREVARRLAYTDATIEQIADELGFANRHHLSRLFKRMMNESPATFRRRLHQAGKIILKT